MNCPTCGGLVLTTHLLGDTERTCVNCGREVLTAFEIKARDAYLARLAEAGRPARPGTSRMLRGEYMRDAS